MSLLMIGMNQMRNNFVFLLFVVAIIAYFIYRFFERKRAEEISQQQRNLYFRQQKFIEKRASLLAMSRSLKVVLRSSSTWVGPSDANAKLSILLGKLESACDSMLTRQEIDSRYENLFISVREYLVPPAKNVKESKFVRQMRASDIGSSHELEAAGFILQEAYKDFCF